jgi:hypothetical protein
MLPYAKRAPVEKKEPMEPTNTEEFAQDEQVDNVDESEEEEAPAEKPRQKIVRVDQMCVLKLVDEVSKVLT